MDDAQIVQLNKQLHPFCFLEDPRHVVEPIRVGFRRIDPQMWSGPTHIMI